MCTQKMRALSYIGAEKITFLPKPDIHTDRQRYIHTYRRTDISVYRVASLLINIVIVTKKILTGTCENESKEKLLGANLQCASQDNCFSPYLFHYFFICT